MDGLAEEAMVVVVALRLPESTVWPPATLAWLLAKPGVTAPIVGASKPLHLDEAVAALDVRLDDAELTFLQEPYQPHPILGHS